MNVIEFTWPSCAINYWLCIVKRSQTQPIPFIYAVASMFVWLGLQSKLVTGAAYGQPTPPSDSCLTSQRSLACYSFAIQILTHSPAVAIRSLPRVGSHAILDGGYSWANSCTLTSRLVVNGCYGYSLEVVVASVNRKISTLLLYRSIDREPTATVIFISCVFLNPSALTLWSNWTQCMLSSGASRNSLDY